ncbi:MAG: hypothetical protein ACRC41_16980 [Sarcina sp.]
MRIRDIYYRAKQNIKNNKKRSFKISFTVFLASFVIIIMSCLYSFSQNIFLKLSEDTQSLKTINIWGVTNTKVNGLVDVFVRDAASAWEYNDAKKLVDSFDRKLGRAYIFNELTPDFSVIKDETHTFKNLPVAVSFNELKSINNFQSGAAIKDINGAIVTKKFVESAVLSTNFENNKYVLETKDIVGKTLECTILKKILIDGNATLEEFTIPIRIDGVIDNSNNIYANDIIGDEEDKQKVFNDSALLLPIERIEAINEEFQLDYPFNNSNIIIKANDINSMDAIIENIDKTKFSKQSEYSKYTTFKYLNSLLQIIFGILGGTIIVSAIIGVTNMMHFSFLSKVDEFKILKMLRIKTFDLKAIYMCELIMLISSGIFMSILISIVPIMLINSLKIIVIKLFLILFIFGIFLCSVSIIPCNNVVNKIEEFK